MKVFIDPKGELSALKSNKLNENIEKLVLQLRKIAEKIHKNLNFSCKEKCDRCCEYVVCTQWELDRMIALMKERNPNFNFEEALSSDRCPFYDVENCKCQVYEERPIVCRFYGVTREMKCPHLKVTPPKLSGKTRKLLMKYKKKATSDTNPINVRHAMRFVSSS